MEEYVSLLRRISLADMDELKYRVDFSVLPGSEIVMSQEFEEGKRKNKPLIHEEFYSFYIKDTSMEPEGELGDCMETYSNFEYCENLNPRLRRQWKVGYIADNLAHNIIESGLFTPLCSISQESAKTVH